MKKTAAHTAETNLMKRTLTLGSILCLLLPTAVETAWGQSTGYRLRTDRVEIQTRSHWQTWSFPGDMVDISNAGSIQSKFVESPQNAARNVADFTYEIAGNLRDQYDNSFTAEDNKLMARGGVKKVGSRPSQAPLILDGDPLTFWEPSFDDPSQNWVLEIDLGRLVSATRIVLHFADDGDPFLQFRLHAAAGQNPFGTSDRSGALDYVLVGGTTQPNREQREFEFDLEPLDSYAEEWTGRAVQYVRIAVTASRLNRAEQISELDYQALAVADRGAVEYIWEIAGEERLVTPEEHAALPAEQRGEIRHYRRERPRLADLEVWTVGRNISMGLIERGGSLHDVNPNSSPELAFDGNIRTEWSGVVYDIVGETAEWGLLNVDLGAHFRLDAVRFITRIGGRSLYGYLLRGSDGSRAPDGSFIWEELSSQDRQLNQGTRQFEDRFESRSMRFLEFRNLDIARRTKAHLGHRISSHVAELQVFANGYLPLLEMTSDLIDLGAAKNLTTITWEADTPPGTAVEISTRTGDDLREIKHFFKKDGSKVANEEEYNKLPTFFQGDVTVEVKPGNGWSSWSQAYSEQGEIIRSPSPRRYMMIQARLLSQDPDAVASLKSIHVHFTPPLAESILGEIEPKREVAIGEPIDFELYLDPSFIVQNPGFDRIRIIAPARSAVSLKEIFLGTEDELETGTADRFTRTEPGKYENGEGQLLETTGEATDTLHLELPQLMRRGRTDVVRVSFTSRIFQSGSTFQVAVGNSEQPDNWQMVDPGDVVSDALGTGEGLTVLTPLGQRTVKIIGNPGMLTPNGDQVNDQITFEFAILKVNTERPVQVSLFDLGGRRVRLLSETRPLANGLYRISWDGSDENGDLVPPGLYLARIGVASDGEEKDRIQQLVGVAY